MDDAFIGRGWGYPLRVTATGGIALVGRERELEESMRLIIGTARGERPMRPEFGCGIHDYVFAGASHETANAVAQEVRISLARWEPRVVVQDVLVTIDDVDASLLYIDIRYSPRSTNDPRNLVFPFYTIPSGGE